MHWFSIGVALLAALGIIWIGVGYLWRPRSMAPSFGLPLPEEGVNVTWWLRLKGVRDVVSGMLILTALALDGHRVLGVARLLEALIPISDKSTVLAGRGVPRRPLAFTGSQRR